MNSKTLHAAVTPDGIIPNTFYDNSTTSCCYVSDPMHIVKSSSSDRYSFDFGFSGPCDDPMSSADELFLNGEIQTTKLSSHLQRQLIDVEDEGHVDLNKIDVVRGRDLKEAPSLSPLNTDVVRAKNEEEKKKSSNPSTSTSFSRSSSGGTSSGKTNYDERGIFKNSWWRKETGNCDAHVAHHYTCWTFFGCRR